MDARQLKTCAPLVRILIFASHVLLSSSFIHSGRDGTSSRFTSGPFKEINRRTSLVVAESKAGNIPVTVSGPSVETKPDYENIHGPLGKHVDRLFLTIFRSKLAEKVGCDSNLPKDDYDGLIELTAALNARFSNRVKVQQIAQEVLRALFPDWLPGRFAVMFSKPLPEFSARMNAWATMMAGTWLMGETEINDCEVDGGGVGKNQGLLVKRCRFLEESGCASVCVNSCKIPTQNFFVEDMGLPLTMTPDYDTFECQFSFGLSPTTQSDFDAKNTPCISRCPTGGSMRTWHETEDKIPSSKCGMMDD